MAGEPNRALILMYHRLASRDLDPWGLCVAPERFDEQLAVLRRRMPILPLEELCASLERGALAGPAAVLTFDDGYADNLREGKPILERHGAPATVFVVTGALGESREFWWDELEDLLLTRGRLPRSLRLGIDGRTYEWDLGDAADDSEPERERDRAWIGDEPAPTARHALYLELWRILQMVSARKQRNILNVLRAWAGRSPAERSERRPMTVAELRAIGEGGLVEIGAHTETHPVLKGLPAAVQRSELRNSKARLEEVLGREVTSFAYPYGTCAPGTVDLVREAGFARACATVEGAVGPDTDRFRLPRLRVGDWRGEEFEKRLDEWAASASARPPGLRPTP